MNAITQRLRSKTYRVALVLSLLTVMEANLGLITSFIPLKYQPYVPLVFPLIMMYMRELTKTAIDEK